MKLLDFVMFSLVALVLNFSTGVAQTAQEADLTRIAGSWTLNLKKSKERITEEEYDDLSHNLEDGKPLPKFVFGSEDSPSALRMFQGDEEGPKGLSFSMTPKEGSEELFQFEISGGPQDVEGILEFLDENTILMTPSEISSPAVFVRDLKIFNLEEAKQLIVGNWTANSEKTQSMIEDAEDPVPNVSINFNEDGSAQANEDGNDAGTAEYSLEEGEGDNEFVVRLIFGDEDVAIKVKLFDNDTLSFEPANQGPVVFSRQDN